MSQCKNSNNILSCVLFRYHLRDVIVGKIYFLLVRIKIKHMEIDIIKRETTGTGPSVYHESDTIAKYEIMDGAPVRGKAKPFICIILWYYRGHIVWFVLWLLFRHFSEMHYFHMHLMLWFCSLILFRRVDPHPLISRWIRDDAHHERHQQEVLCALLPEPSPYRWRRATILQTTGPDSTYNVTLHMLLTNE